MMSGLNQIPVVEDKHGRKWMILDDFCKFLRDNHKLTDRIKSIKKDNIKREICAYHNSYLQFEDNKTYISTVAVLKYIIHHSDDFEICSAITHNVHDGIFSSQNPTVETRTLLDVYKKICALPISREIYGHLDYCLEESNIPNLETLYKKYFSEKEWSLICLFEIHFAQDAAESGEGNLTEKRWEYLSSLFSAKSLSQLMLKTAKRTIQRREQRYNAFAEEEGLELDTCPRHRPHIIEDHILRILNDYFPGEIRSVTCVTGNGPNTQELASGVVDVFIECESIFADTHSDLVQQNIVSFLNQKHGLQCHHILFFSSGSLSCYKQRNGQIARLSLRDDLHLQKLETGIMFSVNVLAQNEESEISFELDEKCSSCFTANLPKPLSVSNFEVIREWALDVPLVAQMVLTAFINRETLQQSKDRTKTLSKKLDRLYTVYDILINTYNKNFSGILQQAATDELLMNYQSVSNVFALTSASGITTSLSLAERNLTTRTIDDVLYYQTYIKQHPLTYSTLAGEVAGMISLRNCHIVLMLDNLVRLKYHNDPSPGEHRSKQVCMLPITLQGMPKDSVTTEYWHDEDICDGSVNCPCKQPRSFTKTEAFDAILNLTEKEADSVGIFQKICKWGSTRLWKLLSGEGVSAKTSWLKALLQKATSSSELDITTDSRTSERYDDNLSESAVSADGDAISDVQPIMQVFDQDSHQQELLHIVQNTIDENEEESFENIIAAVVTKEDKSLTDRSAERYMEQLATPLEESILETSLDQLTLEDDHSESDIMGMFGFHKYSPPPLLTRHPPPASGRDDDKNKLREILDDILVKTGMDSRLTKEASNDKILFGPDNKIGVNLLFLIKENRKYNQFLPEFPLLHLRKSKINTLFSAYKNAGLVELLMFMRDEDVTEWSKLLTSDHIDAATRNVRRLEQGLQMGFTLKFIQTLDEGDARLFTQHLKYRRCTEVSEHWDVKMEEFLARGRQSNATFALHYDMMLHCREVVAVLVAERLGGENGYQLLLGTVKSSLKFSFLNGASSYAPYCARLLAHHYTAGTFYQKMKETLYSTPIGNSSLNFSCDTKREMDHKKALKGFRSGSSLESASRRMSLIDAFKEIHSTLQTSSDLSATETADEIAWTFNQTDAEHIFRVAEVISRQSALSLDPCTTPYNMYSNKKTVLSREILDDETKYIGEYLIKRFLSKDQLLDLSPDDAPGTTTVQGPKPLVARVKRSKGVTIKRTLKSTVKTHQTEREQKEAKRAHVVKRETKRTECLTSEMNMCQALVKPDCSKPKVQKSMSMKKALIKVLQQLHPGLLDDFLQTVKGTLPNHITSNVKLVTIEFAGVKFKSKVVTGKQYLHHIQNGILRPLASQIPNLERIVLCEEKYSFTPDHFKAATRNQRKKSVSNVSVTHLKSADDVLSQKSFQRDVITGTSFGKSLISKYIAANAEDIKLRPGLTLYIDSELNLSHCTCEGACTCKSFTTPISCSFLETQKPVITQLHDVHQRKGEAELSQVDWLINSRDLLKEGDAVISLVTSGDIDAVAVHLYALSKHWPRNEDSSFQNDVYVVLQKPFMTSDIFNITAILQLLEERFEDVEIGLKLALVLCIGGNDFIPKLKGLSHTKVLETFLWNEQFRQSMFQMSTNLPPVLDKHIFEEFVKHLYCPKNVRPHTVTPEDVRIMSMQSKRMQDDDNRTILSEFHLKDPDNWMPPTTALHRLADLIQLQIDYLETVGHHDADLPNFLSSAALKVTGTGEVEYDFGPDAHMTVIEIKNRFTNLKRKLDYTPQKGHRRKKQLTSTPIKRRE